MVIKLFPFSLRPALLNLCSFQFLHAWVICITGSSKNEWRWIIGAQPNIGGRELSRVVIISTWCLATEHRQFHTGTHTLHDLFLLLFLIQVRCGSIYAYSTYNVFVSVTCKANYLKFHTPMQVLLSQERWWKLWVSCGSGRYFLLPSRRDVGGKNLGRLTV